jgi:hypothetical protein
MVGAMPSTPALRMIAALLPALVAVVLPAGAAGAWLPPVAGPVARAFDLGADPFAPGQHRGADLAAPPGSRVRAPCGGRVAVAGRVGTSGRVVTLLCGPWRVTQMPLATIAVSRGETAARGDTLGTVARSRDHAGLHLGVRRDGDRFAYTDPVPFLGHDRLPPPAVPPPRRARPVRPASPATPARTPAPDRVRAPAPDRRRAPAPDRVHAPAPDRVRAPVPDRAGQPRHVPAGSERAGTADGPPWTVGVGLLLALAAFARRPRLRRPRPRRPRRHARPAHEVP